MICRADHRIRGVKGALDAPVQAGDPAQTGEWAHRVARIGRRLADLLDELRSVMTAMTAAWSDGVGSSRMIGLAEYLQVAGRDIAGPVRVVRGAGWWRRREWWWPQGV